MNQAKSEAFGLKTTCNYTFGAHVYINDSIHVYTHSFRFRVRTSSLKHPKNSGTQLAGTSLSVACVQTPPVHEHQFQLERQGFGWTHIFGCRKCRGSDYFDFIREPKLASLTQKSLENVENQANKQQKSGPGVFGSEVSICFSLVFSSHFQPRSHQKTLVISHAAQHFSRATIPFFPRRAGNHHHFYAFL